MSDFNNDNSGALFKNTKQNDRQPDYRGNATVDGVEYWVSGWIKTAGPMARNPGSKFLSLAFQPKEEETRQQPRDYHEDEDIPF